MKSIKPMRDRIAWIALAIILIAVLLPVGYFLNNVLISEGDPSCQGVLPTQGCFDVNPHIPGPQYNGTSEISAQVANNTAMNGTIPSYAQEFKQNDTIVFHSLNITLLVFGNANTWVSYVSNTTVPAYDNVSQLSNAFAIYHLYEPTLVIPRGATINVTFVNMDYGDHHNFVLSTFPPPYPEYIMKNMKNGGEMVAMTPLINHVDNSTNNIQNANASVFSYAITLNLPDNVTNMWYMCMFPTHAMNGMWGNITLVDPSQVNA